MKSREEILKEYVDCDSTGKAEIIALEVLLDIRDLLAEKSKRTPLDEVL